MVWKKADKVQQKEEEVKIIHKQAKKGLNNSKSDWINNTQGAFEQRDFFNKGTHTHTPE